MARLRQQLPGARAIVLALVALGLALRFYHYLRDPALWHDEAALVMNVLNKSYGDMLGPLSHSEAAPPLFLWIERAAVDVLGDSLWALRLAPLLASCAALLLFAWSAWRLLGPAAAGWAVLLFAVSDRLLWHACEAKPYSLDVFAAAMLLALYTATQGWSLSRRLLLFALVTPLLIVVSYPACFLCGGLLLALLPQVVPARRSWPAYALLTLAIGAAFLWLVLGPARSQRCPQMDNCWTSHFPDYGRPLKVVPWMLIATAEAIRYCFQPVGQMLLGLSIVGGIRLWRSGRRDLVALLAGPPALCLVAALLHQYPYGPVRVVVFAAPGLALLVAAAVPVALGWLATWTRPGAAALVVLLLVPAGLTAYRLVVPWSRADTAGAAAYVHAHRQADEMVCSNNWESEYYFRGLGSLFGQFEDVKSHLPDRFWLVLVGCSPQDWRRFWEHLHCNERFQELERHDFHKAMVVRLSREPGPVSARSAPPRSRP